MSKAQELPFEKFHRVVAAWNAQADEHNQWEALGYDEKLEWLAEFNSRQYEKDQLAAARASNGGKA